MQGIGLRSDRCRKRAQQAVELGLAQTQRGTGGIVFAEHSRGWRQASPTRSLHFSIGNDVAERDVVALQPPSALAEALSRRPQLVGCT